jgi:hypothetical protein
MKTRPSAAMCAGVKQGMNEVLTLTDVSRHCETKQSVLFGLLDCSLRSQ